MGLGRSAACQAERVEAKVAAEAVGSGILLAVLGSKICLLLGSGGPFFVGVLILRAPLLGSRLGPLIFGNSRKGSLSGGVFWG